MGGLSHGIGTCLGGGGGGGGGHCQPTHTHSSFPGVTMKNAAGLGQENESGEGQGQEDESGGRPRTRG